MKREGVGEALGKGVDLRLAEAVELPRLPLTLLLLELVVEV